MIKFYFFKYIYIIIYSIIELKSSNINSTSFIKTSLFNDIIETSNIKIYNNYTYLKKNLIIGAVKNYHWKIIEPFFKSFKKAGFNNCDCIMFVDKMTNFTIKKIKSYGVIVYKIPFKYKKKKLINCRWKIYEDFLNYNADKYKLVFTADLRDVFFQQDIFKFYENKNKFLGVSIEDDVLSEPLNKKWLINAYGEELYKTIEHERIICVGAIWGTVDKFTEFSRVMGERLNSEWSKLNNVIEQAVANYIIYHDKMFNDCLIKSENYNGPVMTIGLTKNENIKFDSENNILNGKGKIAAVIHQYDRKPDIVRKVINKFCRIDSKESDESKNSIFSINKKKDINSILTNISSLINITTKNLNLNISTRLHNINNSNYILISKLLKRFDILYYFIIFVLVIFICTLIIGIIYLLKNRYKNRLQNKNNQRFDNYSLDIVEIR